MRFAIRRRVARPGRATARRRPRATSAGRRDSPGSDLLLANQPLDGLFADHESVRRFAQSREPIARRGAHGLLPSDVRLISRPLHRGPEAKSSPRLSPQAVGPQAVEIFRRAQYSFCCSPPIGAESGTVVPGFAPSPGPASGRNLAPSGTGGFALLHRGARRTSPPRFGL